MHYDVVTVGAGPAGLAAAIRLKQLAIEKDIDISVCVVEKASEVGGHILSGNVFEPRALNELIPDWKEKGAPLHTEAGQDEFLILTDKHALPVPNIFLPKELHNEGNYIISLSQLCRWLGEQAEELGVDVIPGFAASEVLYTPGGAVRGVATRDVGIAKDGSKKGTYAAGVELIAKQTLFAEGCRGSCSTEIIEKFNLQKDRNVQTYGLGIKEVWQVPEDKLQPGLIQHSVGWPLQSGPMSKTYGGTFLYHMKPNLVLLGMVVGLDYANPHLSPYKEFQRWKHHPEVAKHLEGGECISYGARCLNEGGIHSTPKSTFPGGVLIGCSAGYLNSVKIKGSHTAMKSGMIAAESIYPLLTAGGKEATVAARGEIDPSEENEEAEGNEFAIVNSWIGEELRVVRNSHGAFHKRGMAYGMIHTAFSSFITKGFEPWTFRNKVPDCDHTLPAAHPQAPVIDYPKPDGKLSFDLLTNLQRSGTFHEHDQPAHLRVKPHLAHVPSEISITEYAGPEQRFCPAGVYEYSEKDSEGKQKLIINAQNCVHCKCCSIKTPQQFIEWTVPEGGGGPAYTVM